MEKITSSNLVLASSSPRRLDIMNSLGYQPQVYNSAAQEIFIGDPAEIVCHNALAKARAAGEKFPDKYIIAADTIVVKDGEILGKPQNAADARRMLELLSASMHKVYTASVLLKRDENKEFVDYNTTKVLLKPLSEQEIQLYIESGEPLDKAGAYGIQGRGAVFVERIEGDYGTVVGLSPSLLYDLLKSYRISSLIL
ncbi:MAG: Maf family protein [Bacillota bacterium]